MRKGQHIRVDIILRAVPPAVGWIFEWIVDVLAMACCAIICWYSALAAYKSYAAGSMSIKTLVTPEWWLLSALPLAFAALTLEMFFRMHRLWLSPRAPRDDAVSTG
jgi:TRAP-type C4-dicarboxylate transport system permease small subunit